MDSTEKGNIGEEFVNEIAYSSFLDYWCYPSPEDEYGDKKEINNKYINFSGGIFAANKNKQDFQNEVYEVLKMFRFNQSRYRWYKGADEYTYWTIYEGKDSDPVTFDK